MICNIVLKNRITKKKIFFTKLFFKNDLQNNFFNKFKIFGFHNFKNI